MERKQDKLLPIGEAAEGFAGLVQALLKMGKSVTQARPKTCQIINRSARRANGMNKTQGNDVDPAT